MQMRGVREDKVIRDVADVAKWRMCIGCGACASACPEKKVTLVDFLDDGIRPTITSGGCDSCSECVRVCPGIGASHGDDPGPKGAIESLRRSWGPVLEVWEGHAADADVRFNGSSGGLATALSLYCIEQEGMGGVVHVAHEGKAPYRNRSAFSRTRPEMLSATGSRYSPASPCDNLKAIEESGAPCVFIGKPCDVEGLRKTQAVRPVLSAKVGVAIGIFCAGTPSTKGTLDLLEKHGINAADVEELRYRGRGWPGSFAVRLKGHSGWKELATYEEAWGFLQRYRPLRCYLCPDSTSEFADISCGDPWYHHGEESKPGISLVLVRTEKGREIVKGAIRGGYVQLVPTPADALDRSQRELQRKRGAIWGRVTTMRALGVPSPRFEGFSLFRNWLTIPVAHKVRSFVGTAFRIVVRKYFDPL